MSRLVSRESLYNLAKTGQGQIDALALCKSISRVGADTSLPWKQGVKYLSVKLARSDLKLT